MNNQQIPILIISLTHALGRRKFMREQMARLKIDYEFFDAVDGNKLSHADISKLNIKEGEQCLKRQLSQGEIGAAVSHLHVYEKMLAENIERLIVLEDDAQLNDDFTVLINNLNSAPLQWDLAYLGHSSSLETTPLFGENIYPLSLWESHTLPLPPAATTTKYRMGPPIVPLFGAYAYVITKKGAEKLIQTIKYAPLFPADERLAISGIKQHFAIMPRVAGPWRDAYIEAHINHEYLKQRSDLPYIASKFMVKVLRKVHPHAPEYWEATKVLRNKIKSTLLLVRSKKLPYNDVSS